MPPHYYPRNQKRRPHSSRIPAEIAQLEAATAEAEKKTNSTVKKKIGRSFIYRLSRQVGCRFG